jgi:2-oxoglutarate ferredoxin oxidoreductase subunit delta
MERGMEFWRTPLDSEEIVVSRGVVHIIEDRCKGCGYCIQFCPKKILAESKRFNKKSYHPPEVVKPDCVNCHFCEIICPEFAIYSVELDPEALKKALAPQDQQGCDCCPPEK